MTTIEAPAGLDLTPITQRFYEANDLPFGPTSITRLRASTADVPALIDEVTSLRQQLTLALAALERITVT